MCGRFVVTESSRDLIELFDIDLASEHLPQPSYNVKPTDQIPVILESVKSEPTVRRLESARWSLVPSFAKELTGKFPTFNARSEDVAAKAAFAESVISRRAIIPAAGYYEWHTVGTEKTPYYVHAGSGAPIAFAGLYSWWKNEAVPPGAPGRWVLSATILTRDAVGELAGIHPRTPVMLSSEFWDAWLDPNEEGDQSFVDAAVDASTEMVEELVFHEVAPLKDDGPELIQPVTR
jgi:putative SOS response-associated peptidase YedK